MAENVILAEQYLDGFSYDEHTGYYAFADETGWFSLEEGVVYHIVWDGVDYYLTSYGIVLDEYEHIAVGNEAFVKGESTTVIEPFVVLYRPAHDWAFILSADDSAAHNVGIYQVIEDEEPETPKGIILRDYKGEETTHYGMEMLEVDTTDGGTELYVRKDLIATPVETTVVLDFSTGDMEVTPADGQVFSKVIIPVPENLKPENIPKDENIAGIIGTRADGGGDIDALLNGTITELRSNVDSVQAFVLCEQPELEILDLPEVVEAVRSLYTGYMFYKCPKLKTVNMPKWVTFPAGALYSNAFKNNTNLEYVDLRSLPYTIDITFSGCTALKYLDIRSVKNHSNYEFSGCGELETLHISNLTRIFESMFSECAKLKSIDTSLVTVVNGYGFNQCASLEKLDFPAVTTIYDNSTFEQCTNLKTLILRSESMVTLVSEYKYYNLFNDTPIYSGTGFIYVPASLVETYKTTAGWSKFAAQFRAIEDYPDICG